MRFGIVTHSTGKTSTSLAVRRMTGFAQVLLSPRAALALLRLGDIALGRIDVRETLDGIESGLPALSSLAARGVTVLKPPGALIFGARQGADRARPRAQGAAASALVL